MSAKRNTTSTPKPTKDGDRDFRPLWRKTTGEAAGVRRSSLLPHEGRERYVDAVQHRCVFTPHALRLGPLET
jgi:hypothetical protein